MSGWILAIGLLTLNLGTDSLHLFSWWEDAPTETVLQALPSYLAFGAMGVGSFMVFARPRVEVGEQVVVLRNVFRDVFIPRDSIEGWDGSASYLAVRAGGRSYMAMGAEDAEFTKWSGRGGVAAAVQRAAAGEGGQRASSGDAVRVRLRGRPGTAELLIISAWAAYPLMAIAASASS